MLHAYIKHQKPASSVYRIENWPREDERSVDAKLAEREITLSGSTFLLFDEGQNTYHDKSLWNTLFKDPLPNIRIVIFCSYGSPSNRVKLEVETSTPNKLHDRQKLQLKPTPDFPFGLLLTREDFDDMVRRTDITLIRLSDEVCTSIFEWTGGHVGLVEYFLVSIKNKVSL